MYTKPKIYVVEKHDEDASKQLTIQLKYAIKHEYEKYYIIKYMA